MADVKEYAARCIIAVLAFILLGNRIGCFPRSAIMRIWVFETSVAVAESQNQLYRVLVECDNDNLTIAAYVSFRIAFLQYCFYILYQRRLAITRVIIILRKYVRWQIEENIQITTSFDCRLSSD